MTPTTARLRAIAAALGYDADAAVQAARNLDSRRLPEPSAKSCNQVVRGMMLETMWRCDPDRFRAVRATL